MVTLNCNETLFFTRFKLEVMDNKVSHLNIHICVFNLEVTAPGPAMKLILVSMTRFGGQNSFLSQGKLLKHSLY